MATWVGNAGIVGTAADALGDVLRIGNTATPAEFPHLAQYVDNLLVRRSAPILASSTERLAAGALVAVFATPLFLAGVWHVFPRRVAFANPIVCMLAAILVDRALPQPLAVWLSGAGLSLGMLAFFALSTAVLWRPPVSAPHP